MVNLLQLFYHLALFTRCCIPWSRTTMVSMVRQPNCPNQHLEFHTNTHRYHRSSKPLWTERGNWIWRTSNFPKTCSRAESSRCRPKTLITNHPLDSGHLNIVPKPPHRGSAEDLERCLSNGGCFQVCSHKDKRFKKPRRTKGILGPFPVALSCTETPKHYYIFFPSDGCNPLTTDLTHRKALPPCINPAIDFLQINFNYVDTNEV